jgi:hypothetical protein
LKSIYRKTFTIFALLLLFLATLIFSSRIISQYGLLQDDFGLKFNDFVFSTRGYVNGIENPLILSFVIPKIQKKIDSVIRIRGKKMNEHGVPNTLMKCYANLYQGSELILELKGVDLTLETKFLGVAENNDLFHGKVTLSPGVYSIHVSSKNQSGNAAIDVVLTD